MNTRVILLRHGQSTYNALGLYQGSSDESVLTELGRQQARQTGEFLKKIEFDAIYTSSLKRARTTALEALGVMNSKLDPESIHVVHQLREADLFAWQGIPFKQVRSQFAEDYWCWKQTPQKLKMAVPQTREYIYPALDLYDRVSKFWQEVLPRHQNQTLLLTTHGGTNRALIGTALGIDPALFHTIQQSNCGISILNFSESKPGNARLEALNLANHIGETIPQVKEGGKGRRLLLVPEGIVHPAQNRKLAELLARVTIDFSIGNDLDTSNAIADAILENHPETVRLQVSRQDFPSLWQNTLSTKNDRHDDKLITGLVVASATQIKTLFADIFKIETDRQGNLQLQPGTLSAIYYPNSNHPPIVQAINILGFNPAAASQTQIIRTVSEAVAL